MDLLADIHSAYQTARSQQAASVLSLIECGRLLLAVKATTPHGEWLLWVKANEAELGFGDRTARRLMAAATEYRTLASDLSAEDAAQLQRSIWGHEPSISALPAGPPVSYLQRFVGWAAKHDLAEFDELYGEDRATALRHIAQARAWLTGLEARLQPLSQAA